MKPTNDLPYDTNLYHSVDIKDTEKLMQIWQAQDQTAWTPEALIAY
jgi:hypothetical protein